MSDRQATLFDSERMTLGESVDLTLASLREYGQRYDHWAIAYSGGKDSSVVVSLVCSAIRAGLIERPKRLTVLYSDTRMELPPLAAAAHAMLAELSTLDIETRVVMAPMDRRFYVYMLGYGVPSPNNRFRWCTDKLKVQPMKAGLEDLVKGSTQKVLLMTGVRLGESAARDTRIALSCSKDGAECGQGRFQAELPDTLCDFLDPILHWRTCLAWDWLKLGFRPLLPNHFLALTRTVADAYGLREEGSAVEIGARTGCIECPVASKDRALENLLHQPRWSWLQPLAELRPLYEWVREHGNRLRKPGMEKHANGTVYTNRLGPLTFEARLEGLRRVLDIQSRCNALRPTGSLPLDILNPEEEARIRELVAAETWPRKWTGDEPTGDEFFERVTATGEVQRAMFRDNPLTPKGPADASASASASA